MGIDENFSRAIRAYEAARYDEAERLSGEILRVDADNFRALNMLGMCLHERGDSAKGVDLLQKAIGLNPGYIPALNNLAAIQNETGNYAEALSSIDKVLALAPDDAAFHLTKVLVLLEMEDFPRARESAERALSLDARSAEAHSALGLVFAGLRDFERSLASHERALAISPSVAKFWLNKARTLNQMGRGTEALSVCERAASLKGDASEAWVARGNILLGLNRLIEAFKAFREALTLKPSLSGALQGYGRTLAEFGRDEEALAVFDRLLLSKPRIAEAWQARGYSLSNLKRYAEAVSSIEKALELKPQLPYALGDCLYARTRLCEWDGFEKKRLHLSEAVSDSMPAALPFVFLNFSSSPAAQLQCQKSFIERRGLHHISRRLWQGEKYGHDKIRVAYVSPDLCSHVVSEVAVGVFESHDRSRFEITGLNLGTNEESEMRTRLLGAFDRFLDVREKGDLEIAQLIREMEIDIVIDPSGFTKGGRPVIFAYRPAPVQVNWLGFAGTLGADYVDYIIADETVIPPEEQKFYTEKVVYLPDTYFPNDNRRGLPVAPPTRAEAGLPERGFVFCCFNASYKLLPHDFDIWMRLLKRVDGSVIWLSDTNEEAKNNLRREAEARGVTQERVIFASRMPKMDDHLARLSLADLFLDTQPYNAHATANDALWAGVPVLTKIGTAFAGRVAASLLNAAGLPEMIVSSTEEYETLALTLATQPEQRAAIKAKLAQNRKSRPLFDTARFARHLDAAYETMWRRQQRGEQPSPFKVEAGSPH